MKQEKLSVLAYANGFTLWNYRDDFVNLDEIIKNPMFFAPVANILNVGDIIFINTEKAYKKTGIGFFSTVSEEAVEITMLS